MKIIFVGAVDFSRHCLQQIFAHGGDISAVITLSEKYSGRHSDYADLENIAAQHGVIIQKIRNINEPENVEFIRSLQPDVIFVLGWSQLISGKILNIPPLGCIGAHPALLPRNRGRHPIIWALVEGLTESGLTFFYLDKSADSGDIVWQKPFFITLEDDAGSLYEKIKTLASQAIRELLPQLERGTAPRMPQNHNEATYWRKRTERDGEIIWSSPSMRIYNLVRALTRPYVGAHTYVDGVKVLIWKAALPKPLLPQRLMPPEVLSQPSGTILSRTDAGIDVRTGDGYLTVLEYEASQALALKAWKRLGGYT